MLTEARIIELFQKHVLINYNRAYSEKYRELPLDLNAEPYRWENHDLPRIIALLEFREYSKKYNDFNVDQALILNGGEDPERFYLHGEETDFLDYQVIDGITYNDLHTGLQTQKRYDIILANQTFEHLYNPFKCLDTIKEHLTDGGYFYLNAPAINISHSVPFHFYTGFTPIGLVCMLASAGFDVIEFGQWGNKEYIHYIVENQNWPDYRQLSCFDNDFSNPAIVWALAKKSSRVFSKPST
jgi:hypothetical protein